MNRRANSVVAFCLGIFFGFGVLCATLGAPGQALASVNGCSQTPGDIAMDGCDRPAYLCDFNVGTQSFSYGALSSARSTDSLKRALGLSLGERSIDASVTFVPPGTRRWKDVSLAQPGKVSIRLFNSILNL